MKHYVAEYDLRFPLIACFIGHNHSIAVGRFHRTPLQSCWPATVGSGGKLQPLNIFAVGTNNVGIRFIVRDDGKITTHHDAPEIMPLQTSRV